MSDEKDEIKKTPDQPTGEDAEGGPRFPELLELQEEIERRIRDNQRFLDRFFDEDFVDEPEPEDENEGEDEEEL